MRSLLILSLLFITSCLSPQAISKPGLTFKDRPTTEISLAGDPVAEKLRAWIIGEYTKRCKEQNVPMPKKIVIHSSPAPVIEDEFGITAGYLLGLYKTRQHEIHIWTQCPPSAWYPAAVYFNDIPWFSWEMVKNTAMHELLHHADNMKGLPIAMQDHNAIFDKRLKDLGWI